MLWRRSCSSHSCSNSPMWARSKLGLGRISSNCRKICNSVNSTLDGPIMGVLPFDFRFHFGDAVRYPVDTADEKIVDIVACVLDIIPTEQMAQKVEQFLPPQLDLVPYLKAQSQLGLVLCECRNISMNRILTHCAASPIFSMVSSTNLFTSPAILHANRQTPSTFSITQSTA